MSEILATPARRDALVAAAISGHSAAWEQSVALRAEVRTAFPSLRA